MDELNLNQMSTIIQLPEDAYKAEIICTIPGEEEPIQVKQTLNLKQIIEARKDYLLLDPDDDFYATYTLTDKAKEELGIK